MLIYIKKSLFQEIQNFNGDNDLCAIALQNIAQSKIQGDHIFLIDRGSTILIALHQLTQATINVFEKIESEAAQYGGLKDNLMTYIEISSYDGTIEKQQNNGKTIIKIPLKFFSNNRIVQRVKLIGENLNDCRFYERLSILYINEYKSKELPSKIKFELIGGGGNTTAESFKEIAKENNALALCITDNDKATPTSPHGDTSKLCQVVNTSNLCHHQDIDARYVENLLHYQQIKKILSSKKERLTLIKNLEFLESLADSTHWFHLPLKTGLKNLDKKSSTDYLYWDSVINTKFDEDYQIPPVSKYLLKWAIDLTDENKLSTCPKDNPVHETWNVISALISSWGCCCEPMRV